MFELAEIAQALDPLMVWGYREHPRFPEAEPREHQATAERFADYLLGRSHNAESIPKNLRALRSLLSKDQDGAQEELLERFLVRKEDAEGSVRGWLLMERPAVLSIEPRERRFLGLALEELNQNDRVYGPRHSPAYRPQVTVSEGCLRVRFRFREDIKGDAVERLETVRCGRLQDTSEPWPDRNFASHGTGLYLANLAAAVVGWRLSIDRIDAAQNTVVFLLERVGDGGED